MDLFQAIMLTIIIAILAYAVYKINKMNSDALKDL